MLKKELELHVIYDVDNKEMSVIDLLAPEEGLADVSFEGVESVETMLQALEAFIRTINEQ